MEQNYGLDRHLKVKTGAWYKYSECSVLEYLEMVHKWIKALRAMRIKQTPYWPKTPKVLRSYCLAGFLAGAQRFTTHSLSLSLNDTLKTLIALRSKLFILAVDSPRQQIASQY